MAKLRQLLSDAMHTAEGRFELALALRIAAAQARREQINHAP